MKTKFAKQLADEIRTDKKEIKSYTYEDYSESDKILLLPYTYDKAMDEDSTEQTILGSLMTNKILVVVGLAYLIKDIGTQRDRYIKSLEKLYCNYAMSRYLMSHRMDLTGKSKPLDFIKAFEPLTSNEHTAYEQGHIAGLRDAFNHIEFILKADRESLLKITNY